MKIKKFLEKVAEEDRESLINDRDIEFLASVGVDYNKKREAAKNEPDSSYYLTAKSVNYKALFTGIALFLVVAITVISLSLYFSLRPAPIESPIQYFDDNFVEVDSSLQELNDDLQLFALTVDAEEYDLSIKKTYDSVSGDNLYYSLDFVSKKGSSKKFRFKVVVNKLYEQEEFPYTDELIEEKLSTYTLKYDKISQPMSGPLISVECKGEIQIGEQWIYIMNFKETAMGKSTFVETLQSLIQFK